MMSRDGGSLSRDFALLFALFLLTLIVTHQGKNILVMQDRITTLEQRVSDYEIRTQDVLESYDDIRETQVNLIQLYEESGKFNK